MEWSLGSFGDVRLDQGGGTILERMVGCKTVCLRRLGGNRGGELQAGRFFANPKVTAAKIVEGWSDRTMRRSPVGMCWPALGHVHVP